MPIYTMQDRTTFAFSAENPTGARNGGTRGGDCEKLRPCIDIQPGETATLCDTQVHGLYRPLVCPTHLLGRYGAALGGGSNLRVFRVRL